jgi:DinB superfamily
VTTSTVGTALRNAVTIAAPLLLAIPEADAARAGQGGKWSLKQVIGHLIDSASNNHQRFVRAQFSDELVFVGYEQDRWVEAQQYQTADWPALVDFWRQYNLHLARVIDAVPDAVRSQPRVMHNLHQIAYVAVPETEPVTLEYFMQDYVDHLSHHLRQILTLPSP